MKSKHGEIIKCSLCDYQSRAEINIRLHTENKHQNITYDCDECDAKLVKLQGLKKHKENKHKGVRYKCSKCDYMATQKGNLKVHIQAMHEEIKYPCDDCSFSASTPRGLSLHKRTKCRQQANTLINEKDLFSNSILPNIVSDKVIQDVGFKIL